MTAPATEPVVREWGEADRPHDTVAWLDRQREHNTTVRHLTAKLADLGKSYEEMFSARTHWQGRAQDFEKQLGDEQALVGITEAKLADAQEDNQDLMNNAITLARDMGTLRAQLAAAVEALRSGNPPLSQFLNWLADRMVHQYGENPNMDFVLATRRHASEIDAAIAAAQGKGATDDER